MVAPASSSAFLTAVAPCERDGRLRLVLPLWGRLQRGKVGGEIPFNRVNVDAASSRGPSVLAKSAKAIYFFTKRTQFILYFPTSFWVRLKFNHEILPCLEPKLRPQAEPNRCPWIAAALKETFAKPRNGSAAHGVILSRRFGALSGARGALASANEVDMASGLRTGDELARSPELLLLNFVAR